ncbi:MAG: hypothetical protein HY287_04225 [Planctomycetes bacterium]|nr:hypothetical protein [Planctomycetota bacterium]MBI3833520.1 hypothetical protein [Planctomycetota bacterium]
MSAFLTRIVGAIPILAQLAIFILSMFIPGCATGARVNLAAADALEGLSMELSKSLTEYHADLGRYDDDRERAALSAFITRVQASNDDEMRNATNVDELLAALRKIRADRDIETQRFMDSRENAAALAEVSAGLRQFAIQASSLDDEAKRYFGDFLKKATTKAMTKTLSSERANMPLTDGTTRSISSIVASDTRP